MIFSQIFFLGSIVALSFLSTSAQVCPVRLPQNVEKGSICATIRKENLFSNKEKYRLKSKSYNPFALVDFTVDEMRQLILKDPFIRPFGMQFGTLFEGVNKTLNHYIKAYHGQRITSMEDYAHIRQFFRGAVQKHFGEFVRLPSDYEPFQDDFTSWSSDEFFSQQRLAGTNPMSLQMVSVHANNKAIGLDWETLKEDLNPNFDWEEAVQEVLGLDFSLDKVIATERLYALRYYLGDDLPKVKDDTGNMRETLSPIALFVASSDAPGGLKPVAIQVDYKPDSSVFTPRDGADWTFAKLTVQTADLGYGQIVEHLAKCHFVTEALCVAMKRHISSQHPVHQIMKFHCREVIVNDVLGLPVLLAPNGFTEKLFAHGAAGTIQLIKGAFTVTGWDTTDFPENIKKRGLNNKKRIPYFPYRDDGHVVYEAIKDYVREYVRHYYPTHQDVKEDLEIQEFVNEVSAEGGHQPYGGNGKIKGFPTRVASQFQLQDILTRWIWQLVGQHGSVGYELSDYASYLPNMPTKTFTDKHTTHGQLDHHVFPKRETAALQAAFALTLSSFRYDRLFDYGLVLDDKAAGIIVNRHFCKLMSEIETKLEARNDKRKAAGQLTYPYMLPRWLPNGIQT